MPRTQYDQRCQQHMMSKLASLLYPSESKKTETYVKQVAEHSHVLKQIPAITDQLQSQRPQ